MHILESFVHIYRHDPPSAGQLQVHNYIHNVYICEMIVHVKYKMALLSAIVNYTKCAEMCKRSRVPQLTIVDL